MTNQVSELLDSYEAGKISRRELLARLGGVVAAAAAIGSGRAAETSELDPSTFQATELNHIALRVTDVERSRAFYMKHLGLKPSRVDQNSAFLTFGTNFLALFRGKEPAMDHFCFSIKDYDVAVAERKLREAGMPNIRRTSGRIYFDDPDGLTVQLAAIEHSPESR